MSNKLTQPKGSVARETNKESIARIFGIEKYLVGYLSKSVLIDSYIILYDESTEKYWYRGAATGTPISWSISNEVLVLITSTGTFSLQMATLGSKTGFDLIGQVSSYENLKLITPRKVGQKILLSSYYEGGTSGGGEFVSVSGTATENGGTICVPTGSTNLYWKRVYSGNRVHIDWFGADPTGVNYSSDAMRNALAVSGFVEMQGSYKYGGASIDMGSFDIKGNGSTITFDAGTQWFICTGTIRRPWAKDLYLINGKGYFDFSQAIANSYNDIRGFLDINMNGYTGTAIRLPEIDCPWWVVKRCMFSGLTNEGTIGLWDNGSDNNIVSENKFYKNQYHISTKLGSGTYLISNNDFGQFFTTGSTVNRANIWVRVPTTTPTYSGVTSMFLVRDNKFGNENERSNDVKLLLANESSGMPVYSSYSGALKAVHFVFSGNYSTGYGDYAAHWMRSVGGWLPQTFTFEGDNIQYADISKGKYFCYMDNITRTLPYSIFFKRKASRDSQLLWRGAVSNDPLVNFTLQDPSYGILAGDPMVHSPYPAGIGLATTDITSTKLPGVSYAGAGMSIAASTDFIGGKEAVQGNFSTRYNNIFQTLTPLSVSQPGYIQGEIKIADDSTIDSAVYLLDYTQNTSDQVVYNQFPIMVRKGVWTSYCFPVIFMSDASSHCLVLKPNTQDTTNYPNKVIWSRSRAFVGKTPGVVGTQKFENVMISNLPTSSTGLPVGSLWVDTTDNSNIIKIVR